MDAVRKLRRCVTERGFKGLTGDLVVGDERPAGTVPRAEQAERNVRVVHRLDRQLSRLAGRCSSNCIDEGHGMPPIWRLRPGEPCRVLPWAHRTTLRQDTTQTILAPRR
jgi:hypothetical protein